MVLRTETLKAPYLRFAQPEQITHITAPSLWRSDSDVKSKINGPRGSELDYVTGLLSQTMRPFKPAICEAAADQVQTIADRAANNGKEDVSLFYKIMPQPPEAFLVARYVRLKRC